MRQKTLAAEIAAASSLSSSHSSGNSLRSSSHNSVISADPVDEQSKALPQHIKPDVSKSPVKRSNNRNRSNKRVKKRASIVIQRVWRDALSRASLRPSAVAPIVSNKDDKAAATSNHDVRIVKYASYAQIIEEQYGHWIEGGSLYEPWGAYLFGDDASVVTDATRYSSTFPKPEAIGREQLAEAGKLFGMQSR